MMYKPLSDSTLMSMTKKQIIENLRIAEHNFFSAEETLAQQAENMRDWAPVVHGRWIEQEDPYGDPYYTCSACKDDFYIEMTGAVEKDLFLYSYCPNCGAKMDGKGEEA